MRTNIEIDDELMKRATASATQKTKRGVVEEALQLFIRIRAQEAIRSLRGIGWEGDLEQMRLGKHVERRDNDHR